MSALTRLLAETATRTPDGIAVVTEDGKTTYRELWEQSERAAAALHRIGATGSPVLLAVPPGLPWVIALLAAWRAGAAAVPVDLTHPPARLTQIAKGCHATVAFAPAGHPLPWARGITLIPVDAVSAEPPPPEPDEEVTAYIWHTSGSSGVPKAVVVAHHALAARSNIMPTAAGITGADRIAQLTSPAFDACLWEVMCALAIGAQLHIASPTERLPGPKLIAFLARQRITAFTCTPTQLAAVPFAELPDLRRIVLGGEALHPAPLSAWLDRYQVANAYGPTETCIEAVFAKRIRTSDDPIPIGRPLPGVRAWILDDHQQPTAPGEAGELYLSGDGLADGYLDRPAESQSSFARLALPSHPNGIRAYRTGDRVRALPDGQLTYLGRVDDQLNLGGIRLEPAEVEACAARFPGVRACALVAAAGPRRDRLVLHVESASGFSADLLRRHLAARLPSSHLPALIITHGELPRTGSGKIDRHALPAVQDTVIRGEEDHAVALPDQITGWWREWTGSAQTGPDFFTCGGDSMGALALIQQVNESYGTDITISAFQADPTLAFLNRALQEGRSR